MAFAFKTATLGPELQVSMGPIRHLWFFCTQNSDFSTRIASLYASQPSSVVLRIHNSAIMTGITSLHGSYTSPVVLSMQKNEISMRITRLYESHPSSVIFAFKTATLAPELQVSMGLSSHLLFSAFTTA